MAFTLLIRIEVFWTILFLSLPLYLNHSKPNVLILFLFASISTPQLIFCVHRTTFSNVILNNGNNRLSPYFRPVITRNCPDSVQLIWFVSGFLNYRYIVLFVTWAYLETKFIYYVIEAISMESVVGLFNFGSSSKSVILDLFSISKWSIWFKSFHSETFMYLFVDGLVEELMLLTTKLLDVAKAISL